MAYDYDITGTDLSAGTSNGGHSILRKTNADFTDAGRDLERDGWWRTMSATIAMIRHSHKMMDDAKQTIAAQAKRIRELESQCTIDDLTGLQNRRGFFHDFAGEMDRTNRGHSMGGLLIMIDLDNFKTINDTYGHQAGDAALRLVAKTLAADCRQMDSCARLGGDEFVLLLANTERDRCLTRVQSLIKTLNNLSLVWYGNDIPVRASLGLKDYKKGDTTDDTYSAADQSMYDNKRQGRGMIMTRKDPNLLAAF
jgi:diguanylate cyclase (GGDEF)-like protein